MRTRETEGREKREERREKRRRRRRRRKKNHVNFEMKLERGKRKNDLIPRSRLTTNLRRPAERESNPISLFQNNNNNNIIIVIIVIIVIIMMIKIIE